MAESRPTSDTAHVFVGRQQEMAVLETALRDAMSGRGRLVMLVGEPGIGKTRTARELALTCRFGGINLVLTRTGSPKGNPG